MNPEKLRVHSREKILADHHNGLVMFAETLTILRGRIKGRQLSDGFIPRIDVAVKTSVSHPFKVKVSEDEDGKPVVFMRAGHVNGVIPILGEGDKARALDDLDDNDDPPPLAIDEAAWQPRGTGERALVMLRYELRTGDASVAKVVPVVVAEPPARKAWTFHKLAAILRRKDGTVTPSQQIFFDQYFDASNVGKDGTFTAWPRAAG